MGKQVNGLERMRPLVNGPERRRQIVNGLERRRPRLHECEARKSHYLVDPLPFDAASAALQAGRLRSSRLTTHDQIPDPQPAI